MPQATRGSRLTHLARWSIPCLGQRGVMSDILNELGYARRGGRAVSVEGMPGAQVWVKLTPAARARRAADKRAKQAAEEQSE